MLDFTEEEIEDINKSYEKGRSISAIAMKYKCSPWAITKRLKNRRLKQLSPLQQIIQLKGLEQKYVAHKMHMDKTKLSYMLRNERDWCVDDVYEFCEIVGIDTEKHLSFFRRN